MTIDHEELKAYNSTLILGNDLFYGLLFNKTIDSSPTLPIPPSRTRGINIVWTIGVVNDQRYSCSNNDSEKGAAHFSQVEFIYTLVCNWNASKKKYCMEERHKLESQQSKNSKIVGTPGSFHSIHINFNGMQPSPGSETSNPTAASVMPIPRDCQVMDDLNIPGLRDEAVRNYSARREANVRDDNLKAQFRQTCNVALANGLDLKLIYKD